MNGRDLIDIAGEIFAGAVIILAIVVLFGNF